MVPALNCKRCTRPLEFCWDYGNYAYRCRDCRIQFLLSDVVPKWSEFFDFGSLPAESHLANPREAMTAEEVRAFLDRVRASGEKK